MFWCVISHLVQVFWSIWASVPSVRCRLCSFYGWEGILGEEMASRKTTGVPAPAPSLLASLSHARRGLPLTRGIITVDRADMLNKLLCACNYKLRFQHSRGFQTLISLLLTHKLCSCTETVRETKIIRGLCCIRAAHYGPTPGVWGGPIWGLQVYSYFIGPCSLTSPSPTWHGVRLQGFPANPADWNPSSAHCELSGLRCTTKPLCVSASWWAA